MNRAKRLGPETPMSIRGEMEPLTERQRQELRDRWESEHGDPDNAADADVEFDTLCLRNAEILTAPNARMRYPYMLIRLTDVVGLTIGYSSWARDTDAGECAAALCSCGQARSGTSRSCGGNGATSRRSRGWPGVPDAPRLSSAEASDLAKALERARVSARLRETASKVAAVARDGGINVLRGG